MTVWAGLAQVNNLLKAMQYVLNVKIQKLV